MDFFQAIIGLSHDVDVFERVESLLCDDQGVKTLDVRRRSVWLCDCCDLDVKLRFQVFHKYINELSDIVLSHINRLNQLLEALVIHNGVILDFDDEFMRGTKNSLEQKHLMPKMQMIKRAPH